MNEASERKKRIQTNYTRLNVAYTYDKCMYFSGRQKALMYACIIFLYLYIHEFYLTIYFHLSIFSREVNSFSFVHFVSGARFANSYNGYGDDNNTVKRREMAF